jgi:hypothetical protein
LFGALISDPLERSIVVVVFEEFLGSAEKTCN